MSETSLDYPRRFELVYQDLLAIFITGSEHAEHGDDDGFVPDFHGQAEELFEELIHIPDAPEQTIAQLGVIDSLGPFRQTEAALLICGFGIDLGLKRVVLEEPTRDRLTTLVQGLLDCMAVSTRHASLVHYQLSGKGYLSQVHESTLLGLADVASGDLGYLKKPVMELLVELWSSLQDEEGYRPHHLASLIDDGGLMGEAAIMALLLTDEFRNAVIERLLLNGPPDLVERVAEFAASELSPSDAAVTLERLNTVENDAIRLSHAYAILATSSPGALIESYRESLADGRSEGHRLDAVVAMTSYGGPEGAAAGREAFAQEANPLIRSLALMGLGGERDAEFVGLFEQALADGTLMDEQIAPYLVIALQNYSRHESADALFVAGARDALMGLAELDRYSQAKLAKLVR